MLALFADTVQTAGTSETTLITATAAVAITAGLFAQIVLQLMARAEQARTGARAKADAEKAQEDAAEAHNAAVSAATEAKNVAANVARKVEDVKQTLSEGTTKTEEKLNEMAKVGATTHTLVNSGRGELLKMTAIMARRLAILTQGTSSGLDDEKLAIQAEEMLARHEKQQALADQPRS